MRKITILIISLFIINTVHSTNYYCNPETGNINNDGSLNNPWSTLEDIFSAKKTFNAGDTLFLYGGNHGKVALTGKNDDYVVIKSIEGEKPVVASINITNSSYWKFEGIHFSSYAPEGSNVYALNYLVRSADDTDHLFFESCSVYTTDEDISGWTRDNWFTKTSSGFFLKGEYSYIHNCSIKNTNFSIEIRGRYSEVINNTIENFVGDAIRALSSYSKYEHNTVKNSYDITGYAPNWTGANPDYPIGGGNHDDLFQSYSAIGGGPEQVVEDVVVRWNTFISYTNPNQVDKSYTQGVACFDGYFNNWKVENNLIITDSWHGITLLGVNNSTIANNTIISNPINNDLSLNGTNVDDMTPWVWVGKMKDAHGGGPSSDNVVRNNLIIESRAGRIIIDDGTNTSVENNLEVPTTSISNYFIDYQNFDLHFKAGSPAIDKGKNFNLPAYDLDKNSRLTGPKVDCGVYEFSDGSSSNNCPVIEPIDDQFMEENNSTDITVSATDIDNDPITLSTSELPEIMSFVDNGDGSGILSVSPEDGDAGEFNIEISATDGVNNNSRSFKIHILNTTVGIEKYRKNDLFKIYPTQLLQGDKLHIKLQGNFTHSGTNVTIYDLSGKVVFNKELLIENNELILNTSFIETKGAYVIHFLNNSELFFIY
ncbi:MAG: choice-of-anchor Q domain-containing protein [Bacteroidota bacterium]